MERWTRTTQRTRNESCVRLGKRTPFLRLRAQLSGYEGERSGQNHWTDMTQGTAYSRADISGNGRLACEPEFNFTGYETSRPEMDRWTGTTQTV